MEEATPVWVRVAQPLSLNLGAFRADPYQEPRDAGSGDRPFGEAHAQGKVVITV